MFAKSGSVDEQVEFPIGMGTLPLMRNSGTLLPDDQHLILLSPNANVTSVAMEDSLRDEMGGDPTMLTHSPMSASSSSTSGGGAMCIRVQTRAVSSLYTQVPHFFIFLFRCLCFGKGETDYSWGDPNEHHRLRCTAFVSLLHVLHKCSSYFTKARKEKK
ncbi:unnamed protein product [Ectocarpus sp. 4 AP-2014]